MLENFYVQRNPIYASLAHTCQVFNHSRLFIIAIGCRKSIVLNIRLSALVEAQS